MSGRWEERWYPADREPSAIERFVAAPLALASLAFRSGVALRTWMYDAGLASAHRVTGARVVSVGNLNVGGAGKTPAVIYLARWLESRGQRPAVLSRGYGRRERAELVLRSPDSLESAERAGDEPLLISRSCPGVPVLVGARRGRLAERAVSNHGARWLLLDDGMQHRQLARDVDIVVVDEAVGFGNGRLLPWGPLREPISALERADLIWLKTSAGRRAPLPRFQAPVVRAAHRPTAWLRPDGTPGALDELTGQPVLALAGLARPSGFVRTLESVGARVVERRFFADHHPFAADELAEVASVAKSLGAVIVTTEKDWMRLPASFPVWVLRLGVEVLEGQEALERVFLE